MSERNMLTARSAIAIGWGFLTPSEQKTSIALAMFQLIMRFIDIVALAGIVPLVSLIMDPESDNSLKALELFDTYTPLQSLQEVIVAGCAGVIVLLILSSIGNLLAQYWTSLHAAQAQSRFTNDVFQKILSAPIAWSLGNNSVILVRILANDFTIWSRNFLEGAINAFGNIITVLLSIALVFIGTSWVGLVALSFFALIAFAIFRFAKPRMKRASETQRHAINTLALLLTQALNGIRDVKISSREKFFQDSCETHVERMGDSRVQTTLWYSIPSTALLLLSQIGILVTAFSLWYFGASTAEITSQMTLLLLVTTRAVPAFSRLGTGSSRLWDVFPYLQGIIGIIDSLNSTKYQSTANDDSDVIVPEKWEAIRFEGVSFEYDGAKKRSLSNINLELEHNKSYGIVGPSGAGKSTFVDLILGLYTPTEGAVFIGGQDLSQVNLKSWHKRIGYVPQTPYILDGTVRENVAFGVDPSKIDDQNVLKCLKAVQLDDLLEQLDDGIYSPLGENGLLISGGQRQRIAIARALYNSPEVLILDEATSALDTITEQAIQVVLHDLSQSITIITIAHRMQTIRNAAQILVLNDGQVDAVGTYDELMNSCTLFQGLVAHPEEDEAS